MNNPTVVVHIALRGDVPSITAAKRIMLGIVNDHPRVEAWQVTSMHRDNTRDHD